MHPLENEQNVQFWNENAEFRVRPPRGRGPGIERGPIGREVLGSEFLAKKEGKKQQEKAHQAKMDWCENRGEK